MGQTGIIAKSYDTNVEHGYLTLAYTTSSRHSDILERQYSVYTIPI